MTLEIDVFWSFRSPFSYLVAPRLVELVETYDVTCKFRPVYPIAMRIEGFFKTQARNPLARRYFLLDAARVAERLGMPFVWPSPDPIEMDFETGEVFEQQPYIRRLTYFGVSAERRGRGIHFAKEASAAIFGGVENWNEGEHLERAASAAKLNFAELERDISDNQALYEQEIAKNAEDQNKAGHWGVPLMVFDHEPFFGQDRFETLIWRLKQRGLELRNKEKRPAD